MDVDAVKQRSADAGEVAANIIRRAGAFLGGMTVIAAFAGVHRADEHEIGREGHFTADAGDGDARVLQGLAEHLHGLRRKFGKLIEKEHAVVRE